MNDQQTKKNVKTRPEVEEVELEPAEFSETVLPSPKKILELRRRAWSSEFWTAREGCAWIAGFYDPADAPRVDTPFSGIDDAIEKRQRNIAHAIRCGKIYRSELSSIERRFAALQKACTANDITDAPPSTFLNLALKAHLNTPFSSPKNRKAVGKTQALFDTSSNVNRPGCRMKVAKGTVDDALDLIKEAEQPAKVSR